MKDCFQEKVKSYRPCTGRNFIFLGRQIASINLIGRLDLPNVPPPPGLSPTEIRKSFSTKKKWAPRFNRNRSSREEGHGTMKG